MRMSRTASRAAAVVSGVVLLMATALPSGWSAPEPGPDPGGQSADSAPLVDSPELRALQQLSADLSQPLVDAHGAVEQAEAELAAATQKAETAEAQALDAESATSAMQDDVGEYAAVLYKDGIGLDETVALLLAESPEDALIGMAYTDHIRTWYERQLAAAEDHRQQAVAAQREADAALAAVQAKTAAVKATAQTLAAQASAADGDLSAALGEVDDQVHAQQEGLAELGKQTATQWQSYLDRLAQAGVVPPAVAALLDPAALPSGLVPVAGSGGGPQPGIAQLPGEEASLLVLPAETVGAMSTAMGLIGATYAAKSLGPSAYDCGGLVSRVYADSGVALPATPAEQWSVLPPVEAADAQPGDLVFVGNTQQGIHHVGLVLDPMTMLAADGGLAQVAVEAIPADPAGDHAIGFARPTLPQRVALQPPAPVEGALPVRCGATVYPADYAGSRAWGGFPNGLIPGSALCPLDVGSHRLRCDAAAAYRQLSAAFQGVFGAPLCITDSYRSFAGQVTLYAAKPTLAAVPGTSNHGWGLAVDLCGGAASFGTPEYTWLAGNAGRFGWAHPRWADPGQGREEPWHWEYAGG